MLKITIVMISIAFFSFAGTFDVYAFLPEDNYLWIENGGCVKEKNGAVILSLQINYGKFSGGRQEIPGFDELRAFYVLVEKNGKEEKSRTFYETRIEKDKEEFRINIESCGTSRIMVLVEAKKTINGTIYRYLAKTSIVLFGNSSNNKTSQKRIVLPGEIERQLEINISPEFHYWRETGEPLGIAPLFIGKPLSDKSIYIFDENIALEKITTDKAGSYVYIPPEDKKLNRKSEEAFKEVVIVAEEDMGSAKYISSYTLLLHRSRFKNRKIFAGAAIFTTAMASAFLTVILKRKRFKF